MPPEAKAISVLFTIFIALWTTAALFAAIWPYRTWKIAQGWKARHEPSAAYFVFQRILASLFAFVGLGLLLLPFFR
ncbi:hypothetical protein [Paenibacillus glycinis]|uniref:DUF6199 domain-containing protein n=1 Tax=Paenibacillus glycinis TaxID=2697035 RepID=A0ABW9XWJ3_9BACL|nr:hypothetical protein [Paenibacillus glycinis]NBD27083.1 hypothetical protein [Paenibacillus glycinis]